MGAFTKEQIKMHLRNATDEKLLYMFENVTNNDIIDECITLISFDRMTENELKELYTKAKSEKAKNEIKKYIIL